MNSEASVEISAADNEDIDKKRKRHEVPSLSDTSDLSFDIDTKQEGRENPEHQSAKPKDKQKKRTPKSEQQETEKMTDIKCIERKFTESKKTIQAIHDQMTKMNNKMDNLICDDELETVFKKLFDSKVNDIVKKVKEEVYKSVTHRIDIVEGELHTTKLETDALRKNIKTLNDTITEKDDTIAKLEKQIENTKQNNIERVDELEQYTRRNSVRINGPGLPIEKEGEKETAEQTTKTAVKLLNDTMGMTLEERDIDIAHIIGIQRRQAPRPMIVKFISRNNKIKALKDKKTKLRGTGICIHEYLIHMKAKVLTEARESRETESAWSIDGHIYMKPRANGTIERIKPADYDDWLSR